MRLCVSKGSLGRTREHKASQELSTIIVVVEGIERDNTYDVANNNRNAFVTYLLTYLVECTHTTMMYLLIQYGWLVGDVAEIQKK
jgi:hypothetical protein